jgi:hypothetical protein
MDGPSRNPAEITVNPGILEELQFLRRLHSGGSQAFPANRADENDVSEVEEECANRRSEDMSDIETSPDRNLGRFSDPAVRWMDPAAHTMEFSTRRGMGRIGSDAHGVRKLDPSDNKVVAQLLLALKTSIAEPLCDAALTGIAISSDPYGSSISQEECHTCKKVSQRCRTYACVI